MSSAGSSWNGSGARPHSIHIRCLRPAAEQWEAYLLPVSEFPAPENECAQLRLLVRHCMGQFAARHKLSPAVFIQVMHLHWGGGTERFAAHARHWQPELGLGVWPDREPPRFWTIEDFQNLGPDERPRTLMDQVFQLSAEPAQREAAVTVMLGLGSVVQILLEDERELPEQARQVLLSRISDPSYTCFPFYVPLLEGKSITAASDEQLTHWSCGASVYLRESREDGGILLLTRHPFRPLLEAMEARLVEKPAPEWRLLYQHVPFVRDSDR